MIPALFLDERFSPTTLAHTPDNGSRSTSYILPDGNVAVLTDSYSEPDGHSGSTSTLTYTVFGSNGELVGSPVVLATVSRGYEPMDVGFVTSPDGATTLHYTVVDGGSAFYASHVRMQEGSQTELHLVNLADNGDLGEDRTLFTWTDYVPETRLEALADGGYALLYSGVPNPLIGSPSPGGYTVGTIADPDTLLQRFDAAGTAQGSPSVWVNPGVGTVDRDIGYGRSGQQPEAIDLLRIYSQPDGSSVVALPEDREGDTYFDRNDPAFIRSYVLNADGSLGSQETVFVNPNAERSNGTTGSLDGRIGDWRIVTLNDSSPAFLSVRGTVRENTLDGSLEYFASVMLQSLDENGALVGDARELQRVDDAYASFVSILDTEVLDDGDLVLVTSSNGDVHRVIVPADGSEIESDLLFQRQEDHHFESFGGGYKLAEIRSDGGVSLVRHGPLAIDDERSYSEREDAIFLSTFNADGSLENSEIRLDDKVNVYGVKQIVGTDGNLTVVWVYALEAGEVYTGHKIAASGFQLLTPLVLSDEADTEILEMAGFLDGAGGDDTLTGSHEQDRFLGGSGDDLLRGEGGDDLFRGDSGDDTVLGGDGTDTVFWEGAWQDYTAALVEEDNVPESLRDMGPVYSITGRNDRAVDGTDLLVGVEELVFADRRLSPEELVIETRLENGDFDELLEGTPGADDTLDGGLGNDTLQGLDGNDSLVGGDGADVIEGGAGDDTLTGGAGIDILYGGEGDDTAIFTGGWNNRNHYDLYRIEASDLPDGISGEGVIYRVEARDSANGDDQVDYLINVENIVFSDRSDTAFQFLVETGVFDQSISGETARADLLTGGIGYDTIVGYSGDDTIYGGPGLDDLSGGEDNDAIYGGSGGDWIYGYTGEDLLKGEGGSDYVEGGLGNDTLEGGDGDDTLQGGLGADEILGGEGNDEIYGFTDYSIRDGDLSDSLYGGAGDDSLWGGYGNDVLYGMDGNDQLIGGFGADFLAGQNGDDVITGGALSDLVYGGAGDDFVNGGFGHDRLNGGAGGDRFFHLGVEGHGSDWIQDYNAAQGDVLLFGDASAVRDNFQINFADTEGAGDASVSEAFVIYKPTEQIIWALIDGSGQDEIYLKIGSETFDLLA